MSVSNEQCHPTKIQLTLCEHKSVIFLLDDRANAHTSKKSLIFEMHCGVYEHTGKQRYSTYRQEEYDT
jgi:alpha-D-ribose 1-methylphosphonate 5-triphosphate synthase subunit PhnH